MNCPPLSQRWTNRTYAHRSIRTIMDLGMPRNLAMRSMVMGNVQGLMRRNRMVMDWFPLYRTYAQIPPTPVKKGGYQNHTWVALSVTKFVFPVPPFLRGARGDLNVLHQNIN